MTPEGLRADIPVTDAAAYFNTGASGPSPRRVVDAVCEFQRYHEFDAPIEEGMYTAGRRIYEEARETVAGFVRSDPSEIALTQSTTEGINIIAGSIDWSPGDLIVRTDVEHPAGTLPWDRLVDTHGAEVAVVKGDHGRFEPEDFAEVVEDARLVCLSSLAWNYGTRLPVDDIVDVAHEAGAFVLVDAVQSFGQVPVHPHEWGADFVAGSAHKWPLGPWGSGWLYVEDAARKRLRPTRIGGHGVKESKEPGYEYQDSAAMFDLSTMPAAVYRGMEEAIQMIDDIGLPTIQDRIERLSDRLKAGIPEDRLHSPRGFQSGLVSFDVEDPEGFVERLDADDIVLRSLPSPECARASIHVFNTAEEVDALLAHI